ncbi:MAG: hypothetical protein ACKVQA_21165 [Burkholderiales bacterium]
MNAYIYKADIYCEECAREIMARIHGEKESEAEREVHAALEGLGLDEGEMPKTTAYLTKKRLAVIMQGFTDDYCDSSEYPKGPYDEGGGEADSPQHCGGCREFLENPLTPDGMEYVRDAKNAEWDAFYGIERESPDPDDGDSAQSIVDRERQEVQS